MPRLPLLTTRKIERLIRKIVGLLDALVYQKLLIVRVKFQQKTYSIADHLIPNSTFRELLDYIKLLEFKVNSDVTITISETHKLFLDLGQRVYNILDSLFAYVIVHLEDTLNYTKDTTFKILDESYIAISEVFKSVFSLGQKAYSILDSLAISVSSTIQDALNYSKELIFDISLSMDYISITDSVRYCLELAKSYAMSDSYSLLATTSFTESVSYTKSLSGTKDTHSDIVHSDVEEDPGHDQDAHSDHTDYPYSEQSHSDATHSNISHSDEGPDVHSNVSHSDVPSYVDHTDTIHSDVSHSEVSSYSDHTDVLHSNVTGSIHSEGGSHSDISHSDSASYSDHTDRSHSDISHSDAGTAYSDYTDISHGNISHSDMYHSNISHSDEGPDTHSDQSEYDKAAHNDHTDWLYGDIPPTEHSDTVHSDASHSEALVL